MIGYGVFNKGGHMVSVKLIEREAKQLIAWSFDSSEYKVKPVEISELSKKDVWK